MQMLRATAYSRKQVWGVFDSDSPVVHGQSVSLLKSPEGQWCAQLLCLFKTLSPLETVGN